MSKYYVVTEPEAIRGIYETWPECQEKIRGVAGVKHQSVDSRGKAEALLSDGIVLAPGMYAFTDGNAMGGVGVAIVNVDAEGSVHSKEVSTSVTSVFSDRDIPGLETANAVLNALGLLHNILAELAGLYHALHLASSKQPVTIVHDYEGVGAWMEGRWQAKDPITKAVVEACGHEVSSRHLEVNYQHQRGHQSTWAGRDDFAYWNGRADKLATRGSLGPAGESK